MKVAFYAPMKAPSHPVPSGDRRMAGLILAGVGAGGHEAELASELRTYDPDGDAERQRRHQAEGLREAERLIALWRDDSAARPAAWLTYHVYHKAPDFVGLPVTRALGMPYLVVEPSVAPKRAQGPWAFGYAAAAESLRVADALLCLTRLDMACVERLLGDAGRIHYLPPFLDAAPFAAAAAARQRHRATLAARHGLDPDKRWLLAVGMMRPGDKLESYRRLGRALARLGGDDWLLVVVGDGGARLAVVQALAALPAAPAYLGALGPGDLAAAYAAADLCVWPAAGEAYGMALLEAQAAGLPVVAGRVRGVPDVVRDGETGLLVAENDDDAFAEAVRRLLDDDALRARLGARARSFVASERDLAAAGALIDRVLRRTVGS